MYVRVYVPTGLNVPGAGTTPFPSKSRHRRHLTSVRGRLRGRGWVGVGRRSSGPTNDPLSTQGSGHWVPFPRPRESYPTEKTLIWVPRTKGDNGREPGVWVMSGGGRVDLCLRGRSFLLLSLLDPRGSGAEATPGVPSGGRRRGERPAIRKVGEVREDGGGVGT